MSNLYSDPENDILINSSNTKESFVKLRWVALVFVASFTLTFSALAYFDRSQQAYVENPSQTASTDKVELPSGQEEPEEGSEDLFFENGEISFWVEDEYVHLASGMQNMLNDPAGWSRAGVSFVSTENKSSADITISLKDSWTDIERSCGGFENAAGCASHYVTIAGDYVCTVRARAPGWRFSRTGFLNVINHEIGHCLGVGHSSTRGELMYTSLNYGSIRSIIHPTDEDIAKAKEYLETLKAKTAR